VAGGAGGLCVAAFVAAAMIESQPLVAIAPFGLVAGAAVFTRFPAASVTGLFVLTAFNGTITILTPIPVGFAVDFLLAGLWVGTIWRLATGRKERPAWFWPGVVAVTGYLTLTTFTILTADSPSFALASFRISAWYMLAVLLIGYAAWGPATYARVTRAVVAVAALVGAYAVFRWIVGPSGEERALSRASADFYNVVDGELRVFGSFTSRHELAVWSAICIPFCFAFALGTPGRWRLVAVVACVLCSLGMLASGVRIGLVGTVVGVVLALLLFQGARAFTGRRIAATVVAIAAVGVVSVGTFTLAVAGSSSDSSRYEVILTPERDAAYQTRVSKWRAALDEIDRNPFGAGLGTAGRIHRERGRFGNISSIDVDNSYLKVALEQGFAVMVLFVVSLLLLLLGIARRALITVDRSRATVGIGAAAALASYLVTLNSAVYIEGLTAMAAWTVVGLGVAQFATLPSSPEGAPQDE